MSHDVFAKRRADTDARLKRFEERLAVHLGADEPALIGDHTTVYVTGSGGRGEMSDASDLDLFLVRTEGKPSKIDAALLQTAIIRATRDCNIVEASADGVFLELHSADDFVKLLGSTDDDWSNKFTARMLLLLESRPVVGSTSYDRLIDSVIDGYWAVAEAHQHDYLPYVFVNDVIRYWRVVLLNHESRLRAKEIELREAEKSAAKFAGYASLKCARLTAKEVACCRFNHGSPSLQRARVAADFGSTRSMRSKPASSSRPMASP